MYEVGNYIFFPKESLHCGRHYVSEILEVDEDLFVMFRGIGWLSIKDQLNKLNVRLATPQEVTLYGD